MISLNLLIPAVEAAVEAAKEPLNFGWADFFFYFFALIAIVAAFEVITQPGPINSAIFLVIAFIAVAGEYALLSAHFLAVIQVLVYAGAIMVLFIFVVMLLDLRPEELAEKRHWAMWAAGFVLFFLVLAAGWIALRPVMWVDVIAYKSDKGTERIRAKFPNVDRPYPPGGRSGQVNGHPPTAPFGTTERVSEILFSRYLFPFEAASLLLLVGIIGVVVISRRRKRRSDTPVGPGGRSGHEGGEADS